MILAYIDESGTNYKKGSLKYFNDGPYIIFSSILVTEKKYFDIERTFQDLAKKYLTKEQNKKELHAHEIWESRKTNPTQEKKVRIYFEELIQFTSKLHIPVIFGIQQKNPAFDKRNTIGKAEEIQKARYSLLTLLEHRLGELNETAIIVSDSESDKEELKNLVFQRTKWRYSPPAKNMLGIKPKYLFEYRSNFIIDQLHYVNSKDSLLIQFSDHICFILRKTLEHLYLLNFPRTSGSSIQADRLFVPITESSFNTFTTFCKIAFANYSTDIKDVNMGMLSDLPNVYYHFDRLPSLHVLGGLPTGVQILQNFTPYK